MDPRLAHRPQTSSGAQTLSGAQAAPGAQRLLQMAETASWAVMVLGLGAASLVLVQSYLLGG
jgi:hypothetical protein